MTGKSHSIYFLVRGFIRSKVILYLFQGYESISPLYVLSLHIPFPSEHNKISYRRRDGLSEVYPLPNPPEKPPKTMKKSDFNMLPESCYTDRF